MKVSPAPEGWNVSVIVRNTGDQAGKDVVQLYVHAPGRDMDKPERELKGFAKTPLLAPGEECSVEIFVPASCLASFDEASSSWVTERGRYTFIVSKNASDRGLRRKVRV